MSGYIHSDLINILCCPVCEADLDYVLSSETDGTYLQCVSCAKSYPVVNNIPRFVDSENYASSFGFQWNKFSLVQLDSYNGTDFSEQRFRGITGWKEQDLECKLVLDAGCGAGRFSEIVANKYRAKVVAIDLSNSVDACYRNLKEYHPLVCQTSITDLPFAKEIFDFVYCIGVVQHTPDPERTIRSLCKMVKPGGHIGLWTYELNWKSFIGTLGFKYALRFITTRLPRNLQIRFCRYLVALFFPIIVILKHLGIPGMIVMRMLPVSSAHLHSVDLRLDDFKTWVFLDTYDMYSPVYDKPQRYSRLAHLLNEQGFENIQRHPHGGVSITATRSRNAVSSKTSLAG